jgi:hypothetical protein
MDYFDKDFLRKIVKSDGLSFILGFKCEPARLLIQE